MENASKALIMAGGILISIIVISVFVYMFGQTSELVSETDGTNAEDELSAYNAAFEAYNKKLMYGTDVISVLNKAIDNNKKYDVNYGEAYYVDIEIVFVDDLAITVDTYEKTGSGNTGYSHTKSKSDNIIFEAGKTYSLSKNYAIIKNIILDYAEQETETNVINSNKYTVTYYPAAEFKRTMFTCTDVSYDSSNGRLNCMRFTQYT